jgi:hypothetical protein
MANSRKSRYKEGRIDALTRVITFCHLRLDRVPRYDAQASGLWAAIDYCNAARNRIRGGLQWTKNAPGLFPDRRRRG